MMSKSIFLIFQLSMFIIIFFIATATATATATYADSAKVDKLIDFIKTACASSQKIEIHGDADAGLSLVARGISGKVDFSKDDIRGVVQGLNSGDQLENLKQQRECMKPVVDKLTNILIKELSSKVIKSSGSSDTLVRSDFGSDLEMKSAGCKQAKEDAIENARDRCDGSLELKKKDVTTVDKAT